MYTFTVYISSDVFSISNIVLCWIQLHVASTSLCARDRSINNCLDLTGIIIIAQIRQKININRVHCWYLQDHVTPYHPWCQHVISAIIDQWYDRSALIEHVQHDSDKTTTVHIACNLRLSPISLIGLKQKAGLYYDNSWTC